MWKSKLKVKYKKDTKNPKLYYLIEPLIWDFVTVNRGFVTDFASTPKLIHFIYPPQGKYSKASIVHDFMYSTNWFSKEIADNTFLNIMLNDGVPKFTAYAFYYSVKLFGGSRYGTK